MSVAVHHLREPRPADPRPDDGSPGYAVGEVRRIVFWSLDRAPDLLRDLTEHPDEPSLRWHAQQRLGADLQAEPQLVAALAGFTARLFAPPVPVPPGPPPPTPARFGRGALVAIAAALVLVVAGIVTTVVLVNRPSPAAGTSGASDQVRWHGSLVFGSFDLDQQPPIAGVGYDLAGRYGPLLIVDNHAAGAGWSTPGTPGRQQCIEDISAGGIDGLQEPITPLASVADAFCLRTSQGRTAFIRVTAATDSTLTVDATVWEQIG